MLYLFPPALRLHLACLAFLLAALGLPRPAVAAPGATAVTAKQVGSRDGRHGDQALLQPPEALGAQAVLPRGPVPGVPISLPSASLPVAPTWRPAATLAAHTVLDVRAGELPDYFRTRLLLAALSPLAP